MPIPTQSLRWEMASVAPHTRTTTNLTSSGNGTATTTYTYDYNFINGQLWKASRKLVPAGANDSKPPRLSYT
jgi:hypothetical protein